MVASLAVQQKETLALAKKELEDRGMGKQELAERGRIPSWCKTGEAFQVLPVAECICWVWLQKFCKGDGWHGVMAREQRCSAREGQWTKPEGERQLPC